MNRDYPIIDVHQHNGPWPFAGKWGDISLNLRLMERRGISTAVLSSGQAIVDDMVAGNAHLAAEIAGYDNLYGYVTVNPRYLDLSTQQIGQYASNPQFVGFKIHTSYSATSIGEPRMADLFAVLEPYERPLLIHTWGTSEVRALGALAHRHPLLPIVIAHAAGEGWRDAIAEAQRAPNLYLDFCASNVERGRIERAVQALGPERVLFGTDATLFDPLYMLSCFDEADLSDDDRRLVMSGNATRLFNI